MTHATHISPAAAEIAKTTGMSRRDAQRLVARVENGTMTEAGTAVFLDAGLIVRVDDEWSIIERYCSVEVKEMFASATPEEFSRWFCNLCDLDPRAAEDALAAGLVTRKPEAQ
jgi:hypothetical protein